MRVLWVTSQVLPYVADTLGIKTSGFGGWITNMIEQLRPLPEVQVGIAMVSDMISDSIKEIHVDEKLTCYIAPSGPNKSIKESDRDDIITCYSPDIIHIEGNEFGIQNSFSKVKRVPVLLSLQGILSGYEPYQYGELPIADNLFVRNNRMMLSSWILYIRKHRRFDFRIDGETETIGNVKYIMGRTFWDRAHSYWINPDAKYYSCNRILRPSFYEEEWHFDSIEQHSLFIGNGYSPLKGLHFAIQAVALLKREYTDIKLYCTGDSPIECNKKSIRHYGYSNIISTLIRENRLEENIVFMGPQLANRMIERLLKSHVYVLPSLIENSPNTLGEAMILGMPCVSAYTGGASEMAINEKEALFYRANDSKLLAWQVKRIFDDDELARSLGKAARQHALITHDPKRNRDALLEAYGDILQ